ELNKIENSQYGPEVAKLEAAHQQVFQEKQAHINKLTAALDQEDDAAVADARTQLHAADQRAKNIREDLVALMQKNDQAADTNDNNYIFLSFVTENFPKGLIGLLIAIVFMAS